MRRFSYLTKAAGAAVFCLWLVGGAPAAEEVKLIYPTDAAAAELDNSRPEKRIEPPVREESEIDVVTPLGQVKSVLDSAGLAKFDRGKSGRARARPRKPPHAGPLERVPAYRKDGGGAKGGPFENRPDTKNDGESPGFDRGGTKDRRKRRADPNQPLDGFRRARNPRVAPLPNSLEVWRGYLEEAG